MPVLLEDALTTVLSQTFPVRTEHVPVADCMGRILAEDIHSDMDMPPFDKSAVDGYACRVDDIPVTIQKGEPLHIQNTTPRRGLVLVETIAAGAIPTKTILPGQCSKIMTGAMVPAGADCVVMVENTEVDPKGYIHVLTNDKGTNICFRGEDIKTGAAVLYKGDRITAAHVAVLSAVGVVNPLVAVLPRVGIISTGDELVEPSEPPGPAQIRNSNGRQLEMQVRSVPAIAHYHGIAPDEGPELYNMIARALAMDDLVLLTGGVSMGDFDFVPQIMQDAGVEILFRKIAVQPGKPTVFGRLGDSFIMGLPGNPVSSYVIFEMLVRPFILHMMGHRHTPPEVLVPLGTDFSRRKAERKSMIPVTFRNGAAWPVEYHGSAHINAYTVAQGILIVEIGTTHLKKGDLVHVRPV